MIRRAAPYVIAGVVAAFGSELLGHETYSREFVIMVVVVCVVFVCGMEAR